MSATVFALLVALLRMVGQQALAKMSGYDLVVTVTLGSVIASVALTPGATVADAIAALLTLLGLQEVIRQLQSRNLKAHHLVREPPRVVLWDGQLLEDQLRDSRISADEVRSAVRKAGFRSLSDVLLVVLENDGDWSVVSKSSEPSDESAFFGLPIPGRRSSSRDDSARQSVPAPATRLP